MGIAILHLLSHRFKFPYGKGREGRNNCLLDVEKVEKANDSLNSCKGQKHANPEQQFRLRKRKGREGKRFFKLMYSLLYLFKRNYCSGLHES